MRAHLVQLDLAWEDREENFARVDRALTTLDISSGDLIVTPEMFDSGFSLNTDRTADTRGRTLEYLTELADDTGAIVVAGRTVRPCDCDKALNRATIAAPGQRVLAEYDKVHPISYGREPEAFRGGARVSTFPWEIGNDPTNAERTGLSVCPLICYDLRFPELFRLGLLAGAEVFCVIANWPAARHEHWQTLLRARAIENQAYVLGVNRCGADPHLEYAGGTAAIDPKGETLGELGTEPGVLSVEVDPGAVRGWRADFPAWRDLKIRVGPIGEQSPENRAVEAQDT